MPHQKAVDLDRLFSMARPVILMITHNWGGGVEKHVKELIDVFSNWATFLVLRPEVDEYISIAWENEGESLRKLFRIPGEYELLKSFLKRAGLCRIHFHHLINVPQIIQRIPKELSIPYDVTLHDYYMLCPNICMVDANDRYCGEKGEHACRKCAADRNIDIFSWRHDHHFLLKRAERIFAPSWDTANRFKAYFDDLNILVAYHLDQVYAVKYPDSAFREIVTTENLRVVVMGDLSRRKGADILDDVSVLAEQKNVPLEFHLMGNAYRQLSEKPISSLTVHGSYTKETLNSFLNKINPHIGWIPALWPETYSYVLSEMMVFGIPIAATRIGAFPERLAGRSFSWVLDWSIPPSQWIEFFLRVRRGFFEGANPSCVIESSQYHLPTFSYKRDYLRDNFRPEIWPEENEFPFEEFVDLPSDLFDETEYLFSNPDVAEQVALGNLSSGREHWLKFGKKENRKLSICSWMSRMNPSLVSIIVRTKDKPKLLLRALESIASQTYRPIEVVLLNDNGCELEIDKIKDLLGNISLNHRRLQKTEGWAHVRNEGIKIAKGKYVGFLDDDDFYSHDALEILCSAMDCGGWPVVYGQAVFKSYDEKGMLDISKKDSLFAEPFDRDVLLFKNAIPFNALLFDERLFRDFGFLDESLTACADWDFILKVAEKYSFKYIPKVVVEHSAFGTPLSTNRFCEKEILKAEDTIRLKRLDRTTISIVKKQIDISSKDFRDRLALYESEKIKDSRVRTFLENKIGRLTVERDELAAELEDKILRLSIEKDELNAELVRYANEVKKIQDTISWRITAPIRGMKRIERKAVSVLTFFVMRQGANLNKSIHYIKNYGYIAFLRKAYSYLLRRASFRPDGSNFDCLRPNIIPCHIYTDWLQKNESTEGELISQRHESLSLPYAPLISLIIPVYNTHPKWLDSLFKSICNQSYCNWEAIIVDDCSTDYETGVVIKNWLSKDTRFKGIKRKRNGGVAAASQDGLLAAKGEFVAVVDHDDLLESDALYYVAKEIIANQDVDVVYSDEILMDGNENVIKIVFRPDFSLNYLLSHPYIVHLTVYRKEIGMAVGGYNPDYEVSQDYEFLLKIAAQSNRFIHVPRPLYRWRIHPTSTGNQKQDKVMSLSKRAISQYLRLVGEEDSYVVDGLSFNFFRVRRKIQPSLVDIIIPTRDRVDLLEKCVNSLIAKTVLPEDVHFRIIIADNGSTEKCTAAYFRSIREKGAIIVNCEGPFNFSSINNKSAAAGNGDIILFLNNDIEIVDSEWLVAMLEHAQRPEVGAVGAKLLYPDGIIQHAGVLIGINGIAAHSHQFFPEHADGHLEGGHIDSLLCIRECLAVTAACLMVKRAVFEEIGGFDEKFAVGFGDTDLCLRMRAKGYKNLWTPYARLIHHESASRGKASLKTHEADTILMRLRWEKVINKGDPYYNPNLSLRSNNFIPK